MVDKYRGFVLILTIVEECALNTLLLRQNTAKAQMISVFFVHFDRTRFCVINTAALRRVFFISSLSVDTAVMSSILYDSLKGGKTCQPLIS